MHYFPTITPESHSTSLVFTVPPWFWGKQVLLLLYKMFVTLWGGQIICLQDNFPDWEGEGNKNTQCGRQNIALSNHLSGCGLTKKEGFCLC